MSHAIYSVTSRNILFDGRYDLDGMRKDADCWYEGDSREKSLDLARKCSDDDKIVVCRGGILRDVYEWAEFEIENYEIENYEIVGCTVKIFDPLDRFKKIKNFTERARACNCDVISYIVGDRKWMGDFMRGDHECDLYRYTDTAFGDFTAYMEEGNLWLPEAFSDYAIMTPKELINNEGVTFWQDWQTNDPETRLLYKIFQNY